ncbi:hypothetical protein H2248_002561 [Termitomyces sp. 'cryptogamus']|nr:hypothetical protein H2248_002561 [Termitomyces sp. 'cryptogamus']
MRPSLFLLGLAATAQASSWFGSSEPPPSYSSWSVSELTSWLQAHNVPIPSKTPTQAELKALVQENWNAATTWTYDQYSASQKYFTDVQANSFDAWDESRLREFLLSQGIVAPKGHKDQLVHLAKSQYRAYTDAASSFANRASTAASGDSVHQATQSISSAAAHVTHTASRVLDSTKDYVYSTWDDNKLRNYLESKGVEVAEQTKQSRNDLLGLMYDAYAKVADPVYHAWSDSYLHNWLVSHNVISPAPPSPYSREYLLDKMQKFYYDANQSVYSTWSDSQLKEWLVEQGIVRSNAQLKREKMQKLVEDNYLAAQSTLTCAWSDSQLRDYLVEHGYIDNRSASRKKRDELVKLFQDKYHSVVTPTYLAWPDARLRAYLRQHNVPEDQLPTARPGLLQETRIRWVETRSTTEALWSRVRDIVGGVEGGIEGRLWHIWNVLKNYGQGRECVGQQCDCAGKDCKCTGDQCQCAGKDCDCFGAKCQNPVKRAVKEKYEQGKRYTGETYDKSLKEEAGRKYTEAEKEYEEAKERAYSKVQGSKETVGEKIKAAGEKILGGGQRVNTEL